MSQDEASISNNNDGNYDPSLSLHEFTQQTLMDVNSQPLIQNINPLLNHLSENMLTTTEPTHPENGEELKTTYRLDPHSPIITEFYEKFTSGRMFDSLEALRTETYEYGRKHNVALTTSKSDKTKIYLICKHGGHYRKNTKKTAEATDRVIKPRIRRSQKTGCECMIYARCCRGSFWIIRKSVGEHNHPIAEDPRAYAMYRSLSPDHLLIVHKLLREHVGVSMIVKSLKANGVTNILAKDIENIQQDLKRRDVLDIPTSTNNLLTFTDSENKDDALTMENVLELVEKSKPE